MSYGKLKSKMPVSWGFLTGIVNFGVPIFLSLIPCYKHQMCKMLHLVTSPEKALCNSVYLFFSTSHTLQFQEVRQRLQTSRPKTGTTAQKTAQSCDQSIESVQRHYFPSSTRTPWHPCSASSGRSALPTKGRHVSGSTSSSHTGSNLQSTFSWDQQLHCFQLLRLPGHSARRQSACLIQLVHSELQEEGIRMRRPVS